MIKINFHQSQPFVLFGEVFLCKFLLTSKITFEIIPSLGFMPVALMDDGLTQTLWTNTIKSIEYIKPTDL